MTHAAERRGTGCRATGRIPVQLAVELARLDAVVVELSRRARLLPALVPENAASERQRLIIAAEQGTATEPRWVFVSRAPRREAFAAVNAARAHAARLPEPLSEAYARRLDEVELDLEILRVLSDESAPPKHVRSLARRRFPLPSALREAARSWLTESEPRDEPRTVPPAGPGSLSEAVLTVAGRVGLELEVKVEPRLAAGAATGERTVFIAERSFGRTEVRRLVAHEVLGHAVTAHNARSWPLALPLVGSAGAFADQEGLAICLEEEAGALDEERRRTLALRVEAAHWVDEGASYADLVERLSGPYGLGPSQAVAIAERSARGRGVVREALYLDGYLRARALRDAAPERFAMLRWGRFAVGALELVGWLSDNGLGPSVPALVPATTSALHQV